MFLADSIYPKCALIIHVHCRFCCQLVTLTVQFFGVDFDSSRRPVSQPSIVEKVFYLELNKKLV